MNIKFLNLLLICTSLIGYLEWGGGNHIFLFQGEAEIILKFFTNPSSVIHPFTMLPLLGQILLIVTLFQKSPNKYLTYLSIFGLGLLIFFIFLTGLIRLNFSVLFSTIPFLIVAVLTVVRLRQIK